MQTPLQEALCYLDADRRRGTHSLALRQTLCLKIFLWQDHQRDSSIKERKALSSRSQWARYHGSVEFHLGHISQRGREPGRLLRLGSSNQEHQMAFQPDLDSDCN